MKKATVIEMVLFRTNEGVTSEEAKSKLMNVNKFLVNQEGFISRKISVSDDGEFLDIVYWADMNSATAAANNLMKDPEICKNFSIIDEETQVFKHFEIFNDTEID